MKKPVPLIAKLLGQIIAYRVANIWPQVGGVLPRRAFQERATVKEGKLIATTYKVLGGGWLERMAAASL